MFWKSDAHKSPTSMVETLLPTLSFICFTLAMATPVIHEKSLNHSATPAGEGFPSPRLCGAATADYETVIVAVVPAKVAMFVAAFVPARATEVAAIVVPSKVAMFVAAAVPARETDAAAIVVPANVAMSVAAFVPARATEVAAIVVPANVAISDAAAVPSRATEVASIVVPAKVAMSDAAFVPARATEVAAIVVPVNVGVAASSAETPVTMLETVAIESVSVSLA